MTGFAALNPSYALADRLVLARALEEGGIPRYASEYIPTQILDAIHENGASRADIAALRVDLKAEMATLTLRHQCRNIISKRLPSGRHRVDDGELTAIFKASLSRYSISSA